MQAFRSPLEGWTLYSKDGVEVSKFSTSPRHKMSRYSSRGELKIQKH